MAGINSVHIVGRVGGDVETRKFNSGDEIAQFSVATSETWKDKGTGERKEKTEWHKIKVLGEGKVRVAGNYVNKGDLVGIHGKLETRKWEKDGVTHYSTEIVVGPFSGDLYLLTSKGDSQGGGDRGGDNRRDNDRGRGGDQGSSRGGNSGGSSRTTSQRDLDDDIPF